VSHTGPSPAEVELAADATQPTRIRDAASGMSLAFWLESARPSAAVQRSGSVIYPAGGPGGERIEHRLSPQGVEDFVAFERRPEREALRYRIDVSQAAGLRLVAGQLELLDVQAVPRLRMAAPWLEDAEGRRVDATVTLEGCAADTSPAPPWGRPVTPPGASECVVHLAWGGKGARALRYPAVLDPSWTTTSNTMSAPRIGHSATRLSDGRVLIAGGEYLTGPSSTAYVASADLFDPETGTFAATEPLSTARSYHIAQLLGDGRVLIAAGQGEGGVLESAEIYDPSEGVWAPAPPLAIARRRAAAAPLPDGRILVAGGLGNQVHRSVEIFDPAGTGSWTTSGDMSSPRHGHTLEVLGNGKVMVIAGITTTSISDLTACEIFEPLTNSWMPTGSLNVARYYHASTVLESGAVLVAGGYSRGISANTPSSERFDPEAGTWTNAGSIAARQFHTLTTLENGAAVAVGGVTTREFTDVTQHHTTVDAYDPARSRFSRLDALAEARSWHTATALSDGRLLVAGGAGPLGALATAEVLTFDPVGAACESGFTCSTGHCVHGVCCEAACDEICWSCRADATGQPDGTCAPVLAGTDPHDACRDDGSPSCEQNGLCDGEGACQHYPGQPCTPRPCTIHAECTSGRCHDGICCNTVCTGACRACTADKKGHGEDGVCEPVADGTDPNGDCAGLGSGMCAADGSCASGRCVLPTTGMECAQAGCIDETTAGRAAVCSASGTCPTQGTTRCTPYRCDDTSGTCRTTCGRDADCVSGLMCVSGLCQARPRGAACEDDDQCASHNCADGVCCDGACTGQCEACDLPGREGSCSAVTGPPRGDRPPCAGDPGSPCGAASCDGSSRSTCNYPSSEVICGESSCSDGIETARRCDGSGQCRGSESSRACAPYACGADACNQRCASNDDCATGAYACDAEEECVSTARAYCSSEGTVQHPDGTSTACYPFRCRSGACLSSCSSEDQCVTGALCHAETQTCYRRSKSSGCGCGTVGGNPPTGVVVAWLALVFGMLGRRRSRRR
jgi:uncharacterized protein (TIGR03382 family)